MRTDPIVPFTERSGDGILVVVEGVSRSGKSTLVRTLANASPRPVRLVKWNNHPDLAPLTSSLIRRREITGLSLTLLFITDLRLTYESVALPALERGELVIYDRYFYSAWVRGLLRGLPRPLLEQLASQFFRPDLTLFLDTDLDTTADRFVSTRVGAGYFGVGRDLFDREFPEYSADSETASDDLELSSFRWWSAEQVRVYRELAGPEGFVCQDHLNAFVELVSIPRAGGSIGAGRPR